MSTYVALLDGGQREETIDVEPEGPGLYRVRVRGQTYRVDALRQDQGTMSLLVGTESHSAELDEIGPAVKVWVRGDAYPVELLDERRLRLRRAAGGFTVEGKQILASPKAGKVVKVRAKVGDEVRAGQGLVVVEAMKMENELKSPKSGKLVELSAVEGQAVEGGAKLAVVE